MKKLLVLILCLFLTTLSWSKEEDETLIRGKIESGGYGGPTIKFGQIYGSTGVFFGGQGGWVINHTFVLGGGGMGLTNSIKVRDVEVEIDGATETRDIMYLTFGYGGMMLEYMMNSRKLVHLSVSTLIGAGGVGFREDKIDNNGTLVDSDAFFVMEPNVNLMLNVAKNFRIGVGASYRMIQGVSLQKISDQDLSGGTIQLIAKFGSF